MDMEIASRRNLGRLVSVMKIGEVRVVRSACVMVTIPARMEESVLKDNASVRALSMTIIARLERVYMVATRMEYVVREYVNAMKASPILLVERKRVLIVENSESATRHH